MMFTPSMRIIFAIIIGLSFAHSASAFTDASTSIMVDTTWHKADSPFIVSTAIAIPTGVTLTIEPGVVVKLGQPNCNCYSNISVGGAIIAGTSAGTERVIFTSIHDDVGGDTDGVAVTPQPGDWRMISIRAGGVFELHHVDVRYGGHAVQPFVSFNPDGIQMIDNQDGIALFDDADIAYAYSNTSYNAAFSASTTIINSRFHDSNIGIVQYQGATTISNSTFSSSTVGIRLSGAGRLTIASSSFMSTYGVVNNSATTIVDARNNYWGSATGPMNASNPTGAGATVSGNVLFDPWLGSSVCIGSKNCNSNVLFFPGMMGSRLFDNNGYQAWLPSAAGDALLRLPMNPDGTSVHDISTGEVIDTAYLVSSIYHSFISQMDVLKAQGEVHDWAKVPYDWRLDYDTLLTNGRKLTNGKISYLVPPDAGQDPYIIETLRRLAATSPSGKVTIIAHSNGGLLTKALTNKLGGEASQLIDKIIFVDVPQLGTPKALAGLLHGTEMGLPEFFPVLFTETEARNLGQNMPLTYNLLPSEEYFHYVDNSVLDIEAETLPDWAIKYGTSTHSTVRLSNFVLDTTRSKPNPTDLATPEILNPTLFAKAVATHDLLDHWTPPAGVQFTTIAGWGEETLSGIQYVGVPDCVKKAQVIIQGAITVYCAEYQQKPSLKLSHVIDGDGTVVEPSQHWANGASSTRYWVNLDDYNNNPPQSLTHLDKKHADILEIPTLNLLIKNIITSNSSTLDFISTIPLRDRKNRARLHFTLHSPLTLGFTDSLGNYTGSTATSTAFNIPGVTYERYGDVQWLSIPKELAGQLSLRGVASGSFTLDAEEVNGNAIVATTSFEGVPSSTSTIVTMLINRSQSVAGSSTLQVDYDGDGVTDITLQSKLNDIVLPIAPVIADLTPPSTTASTTGALGTNGWYMSSVLVTLTATDTGSGVASTTYSQNGGATWTNYITPITVTTEGSSTIFYRSIDKAGNIEETNTLQLKIDKTSPEAQISVSTSTQDILVEGTDNLGTTTVSKDISGNVILTDQAGHTTKLFFTRVYSGKLLTTAKLTGVQYDNQAKITLPSSSFLYTWNTKAPYIPLSQTIAVDGTSVIQASYEKEKNKTMIIVLKKNLQIQKTTYTGLKIVKLMTNKGVVGYSF